MRWLEHWKSQVYVSHFSYYKPIITCLSLELDVPILLRERKDFILFFDFLNFYYLRKYILNLNFLYKAKS